MSDSFPDIKSVVARVITNKPVRKTPYQVKGVFMRQYPDEPIIPMLDGSYRDRYLYPRVQVKILNEQIYIIGVHEGVDSVLSICEKLTSLDFGNITFEIQDFDIENIAKHLPADGSVWITNNTKYHNAFNGGEESRIHLVACVLNYKFN